MRLTSDSDKKQNRNQHNHNASKHPTINSHKQLTTHKAYSMLSRRKIS